MVQPVAVLVVAVPVFQVLDCVSVEPLMMVVDGGSSAQCSTVDTVRKRGEASPRQPWT